MVNIEELLQSDWFTGDSPFRANYTEKNPKVCVITGGNATGKSLFRKLIYNEYKDDGIELIHISQAARCRSGMPRMFIYGSEEEDSTGFNTTKTILKSIETIKSRDHKVGLLLDEPEIGCSEELQAGLGLHLASKIPSLTNLDCCYIITHSREFVKQIAACGPSHIRMMSNQHDYISLSDWYYREVEPIYDLEKLIERGRLGWKYVQKRINERKTK